MLKNKKINIFLIIIILIIIILTILLIIRPRDNSTNETMSETIKSTRGADSTDFPVEKDDSDQKGYAEIIEPNESAEPMESAEPIEIP